MARSPRTRFRGRGPAPSRVLGLLALVALLTLGVGTAAADDPDLDRDPFHPPPGRGAAAPGAEAKQKKRRPWFVRPEVGFAARFSKDDNFLPREGFGFTIEFGRELGRGMVRLGLSLAYSFMQIARTVDITINDPEITSCSVTRNVRYHLATANANAIAHIRRFVIWAGFGGGFAYAQLQNPNTDCGRDDGGAPDGVIMPQLGAAYRLDRTTYFGVNLRYMHYFTKRRFDAPDGSASHRYFYDTLTVAGTMMLRF